MQASIDSKKEMIASIEADKSIRIDVIGVLASIIVISNNSKGSISYPFVFSKDSAFCAELLDLFSCLFK